MNRMCFALVLAAALSNGAHAEVCNFLVKLRPTEYHVNKSAKDSEYTLNVAGTFEAFTYTMGKKKREKTRDPKKEPVEIELNIPNFPGLVEIVTESMKRNMLLQAVVQWSGDCEVDPTDDRQDDGISLSVGKQKYLAAIGAITQRQRASIRGQKKDWADIITNQ